METLVFDILICWKWLGANHNHNFNAFLMHSVGGEKYNLQSPKLKLHKIIYGDLLFFNTSHEISHSFQGYTLLFCKSVGMLYVLSNYLLVSRRAKFGAIWAPKQSGKTVWLKVQ